jgi:cytosine/adenosine deaminase-related metal-dependent hydrolase
VIRFWQTKPVTLVNARIVSADATASSLRFTTRVLSIGQGPHRGDVVVDLDGAFVLPGLVNAHDHLELNHYGSLKFRDTYQNATEWVDDMAPRLQHDPGIRANRSHALSKRLFIGGLKNLIAGVTTVAHHNPAYRELARSVPTRVVRRYGWAHSFLLERRPVGARGERGGDVRARFLETPEDAPFMVHVAEGVDAVAEAEVGRLDALGCLKANTVLVHGVAMTREQWARVVAAGAGLVWCPASNQFLFGRTTRINEWVGERQEGKRVRVCLGSDSRITGARDLLDELRVARSLTSLPAADLLEMVTSQPADLLRLPAVGRITVGAPADLLVIPAAGPSAADALLQVARRDISLVTIGGRPMVGSPTMTPLFKARGSRPRRLEIDEVPKIADPALARSIAACPIREPGVACS